MLYQTTPGTTGPGIGVRENQLHVASGLRTSSLHAVIPSFSRSFSGASLMTNLEGIMPFGDAVVSLNPTFGQGVTLSALQAAAMREVLDRGTHDLIPRLARSTARVIAPVWMMNAIADISAHRAQGRPSWWYRPAYQLIDQFLGAAESDPVLTEWLLRRTSLLDSLYMVPPPRLIARAIRHNAGAWLAERRQRRERPGVPGHEESPRPVG